MGGVFYHAPDKGICKKNQLKPSETYYKQWGMKKKNGQGYKPVKRLQFSKSGKAEIERAYATHYLDERRISELTY